MNTSTSETPRQSICYDADSDSVRIIDQTRLPGELAFVALDSLEAVCRAITEMQVRGAPLIGVTAAYGVYLALRKDPSELNCALSKLRGTRPTAVNLQWALERCAVELGPLATGDRARRALQLAQVLEAQDIEVCAAIGTHGAELLRSLWEQKRGKAAAFNILTHCNAGALAAVDWGTALAVVYKLADAGVPSHVWVDETRPRNQGAALTCWELQQRGIDHTLVVDNAGGHLMQRGLVDVCLVGSDRTTANGDVCNKIGTYLKALAARDNGVPFYVALPVSSIDFELETGASIPIEERQAEEVTHVWGIDENGRRGRLRLAGEGVKAANPGFDVTPASLISGLITERGVVAAEAGALAELRP